MFLKYKGRNMPVVYAGNTPYGKKAKLEWPDTRRSFWVDTDDETIVAWEAEQRKKAEQVKKREVVSVKGNL